MILWTVEPYDRIFPTELSKTITMNIASGFIEGSITPLGFSVSRLVSTNPADYLKSEYSPGHIRKI